MAKALYGFRGGPDLHMETELRRLRRRVQELEFEVAELQAREAERLAADDLDLTLLDADPALV